MIHFAVALVVLSLSSAAPVLAALLIPAALGVDGLFVIDTCAALIISCVLLWYVRRLTSCRSALHSPDRPD